jgi:serine/threonine protein kinase
MGDGSAAHEESWPLSLELRIEAVCRSFEAAWKVVGASGTRPRLEDYLAAEDDARWPLLRELLKLELHYRGAEPPSAAELARRFPEYTEQLASLVPARPPAPERDHGSNNTSPEFPREVREPPPPRAELPSVPGHEVLDELGRGGMGVVYRARQKGLNRTVALKMIRSGPVAGSQELARFHVEARAVAALDHPNVVRIYDYGEYQGLPYFSMELVAGRSLAARLGGQGLPVPEAAGLLETLARAMHAVHQRGIIHRDLKPANVLLTAAGVPKIADFGLARRLDESQRLTPTGAAMGTASYMAPEQAEGQTDLIGPLSDVYSLGAILYETLTGGPPFRGATFALTVLQVLSDEPVPPSRLRPEVPRELEAVCLKCLAKEPAQRYTSALELAEDLQRFLAGEPVSVVPEEQFERHARWARQVGYEIVELLGSGWLGPVYKARQVRLNRLVALLLPATFYSDSQSRARFQVEAEAIACLNHPHIVQIYDVGEHKGQLYLAMEFVDGGSLAERYGETPLAARQAAELIEMLAGTIQYAHALGLVNRNLRPSSVLLTTQGVPKVSGFGLRTPLQEEGRGEADAGDSLHGWASYLAPEQVQGRASVETDVYALGAILYKLLTGQPPFLGETLQGICEQVLAQEPVPPGRLQPDVPADLEVISLKCLRKEPRQRYASAKALAADLRRFLDEGDGPSDIYSTRYSLGPARPGITSEGSEPFDLAQEPGGRLLYAGYEVLEELGRSSIGPVYRACQRASGRVVALRVVLAPWVQTVEGLVNCLRAATSARGLQHPTIAQVYEVGEQDGRPFIALEYLEGGSLASKLGGDPWPGGQAAELAEALAGALDYAHGQGLIHRDLKPANVLFSADDTPKFEFRRFLAVEGEGS